MEKNIKSFLDKIAGGNILSVFIFFVILISGLGLIYYNGLNPADNDIQVVISNFTVGNYSIPYHVAERYLIWRNMRSFFFMLSYSLTLFSIVANLMTVFYASTDQEGCLPPASGNDNTKETKKNTIIFLSLLSVCFTIANIFINPSAMANMSQHAWRELDVCIIETIHRIDLSQNEKNIIIVDKVAEMEFYIETFEH